MGKKPALLSEQNFPLTEVSDSILLLVVPRELGIKK